MDSVQRLTVLTGEPIAAVNPLLHGHFAEHLGELIYPGICVSPDSAIPNTNGIRHDVVAALKPLNIPVLRWPGGCFADTYHWRDGIGPRESRPMRVNTHWGMAPETNQFGTHEFMEFCRLLNAQPYFAANLGSATPAEMRDWIEYCNFGGESTLASERAANGAKEPFNVRYWGVGNENWGCGGNMTPEEYAGAYSRYRSFAYDYPGSDKIERIACGPSGNDWGWTRRFFETLKGRGGIQAFAAHYYCNTAGTATEYTETQWIELLARAAAVDGIIAGHRSIMDEFDPERKIKLFLDEWGTWHPVEAGKPRGGLYQQNTIRDACVAAISLDTFNNNADKLVMANIAQLINVLQALLLVDGDKCIKTPTYHVFDLYQPHKGATALRIIASSEILSKGEASADYCKKCTIDGHFGGLRVVQGSASITNGSELCITAVNSHPTESVELEIDLHGATLGAASVVLLEAAGDIHAHNTFDDPDRVQLGAAKIISGGGRLTRVVLPPASVARVMGKLGG